MMTLKPLNTRRYPANISFLVVVSMTNIKTCCKTIAVHDVATLVSAVYWAVALLKTLPGLLAGKLRVKCILFEMHNVQSCLEIQENLIYLRI